MFLTLVYVVNTMTKLGAYVGSSHILTQHCPGSSPGTSTLCDARYQDMRGVSIEFHINCSSRNVGQTTTSTLYGYIYLVHIVNCEEVFRAVLWALYRRYILVRDLAGILHTQNMSVRGKFT